MAFGAELLYVPPRPRRAVQVQRKVQHRSDHLWGLPWGAEFDIGIDVTVNLESRPTTDSDAIANGRYIERCV